MKRLLTITLIAALVPAAVAEAGLYDVDKVLGDDVERVAPRTDVPIRLPAMIRLDYDRGVFGDGSGTGAGWEFEIAATRQCGANACFLARFSGEEDGEPAFRRKVSLANGITGYYKPLSCGGSCSPPMIQWVQGGVLYSIQAKVGVSGRKKQRRAMKRSANSAIRSTPQ